MTLGGENKELHGGKTDPDYSFGFREDHNLYSIIGLQEISID